MDLSHDRDRFDEIVMNWMSDELHKGGLVDATRIVLLLLVST